MQDAIRVREEGVVRERVRERVRQAIRAAIARRTLLPGQQVPEVELAASLGVSRTPVREALRELEQQGLVVSYPHRGCFIRTFSWKDMENLVFLRAALEGMAAFQAVEHASRAQVRRLDEILDQMASGDPAATSDKRDKRETGDTGEERPTSTLLDLQFHESLVALSGNDEIVRAWHWIDPLIRTLLGHDLRAQGEDAAAYLTRLVSRHRLLVRALLEGDAAAAEQAARGHVLDAGQRVVAAMRRKEDEDLGVPPLRGVGPSPLIPPGPHPLPAPRPAGYPAQSLTQSHGADTSPVRRRPQRRDGSAPARGTAADSPPEWEWGGGQGRRD